MPVEGDRAAEVVAAVVAEAAIAMLQYHSWLDEFAYHVKREIDDFVDCNTNAPEVNHSNPELSDPL